MIRLASINDIPELKAVWREVFQEEEEYLKAYFNKLFLPENSLIFQSEGRIVASLYMVPYSMMIDGVEHRLLYLYAIGTLPEYRGRGYAGAITREALQIGKDRGYSGAFLVPAEKSLFDWYEGMGFETAFQRSRIQIDKEEFSIKEAKGTWKTYNTSNLDKMWELYRESSFYRENWVRLTREQNDFFLEELFRTGGQAWILENEGSSHYALLQQEGEDLVIYETTISQKELPIFMGWVRDQVGIQRVTFHQPHCFKEDEKRKTTVPFAMIFQFGTIPLNNPGINRVLM